MAVASEQLRLEHHPESQLRGPGCICNSGVLGRLSVLCTVFLSDVRAVIRVVEDVEDLDEPFGFHAWAQREALLQAHVDAVNRLADEVVQRNDRAVWPQAVAARVARKTHIAAVCRRQALAGSEEIDAAHLQAVLQLPDTVEDRAVTLITDAVAILRPEVRSQGETAGRRSPRPLLENLERIRA